MASSALDFLTDDHDLTTSVPGARFVHAGPSITSTTHAVHGALPVHESAAAPEAAPVSLSPRPWSPGSGTAAPVQPGHAVASSAPSTSSPVPTGAAAPVHPTQVAASDTTPTAPPSAIGPAAPDARAQVVASGTGRTAAIRPIAIPSVINAHSMHTRGKAGIAQPVDRLNLHVVPMSPLPRSIRDALSDPN
ncbi:uncharacterized protein [Miscanthus floridulus]|uniref:uncharacterized protein n=1 Tax=Miscanthus floridulus TaxID=154761 RepID=UPI00345A5090